jgi:hypothetical protein
MKYFIRLFLMFSFANSFAQNTTNKMQPETPATKANDTEDKALIDSTKTIETANTPTGTTELGEVTGTKKYKYTCSLGTEIREITIITQADNSIGVVYKKSNSTSTIALAKNDPSYADQKADKVKGNLEAAGYTCTKE